jgi:hypothetical protein
MLRRMICCGLALFAGGAAAQPLGVPLADVLEVLVLDRQLVAIDAESGGQRVLPLRITESALWTGSRGRVGVVITDQRLLAVGTGSGAWQQTDRYLGEAVPPHAVLGDRVALVLTSERVVGFDGGSGNFVESRLGVRERLLAGRAGENVAVVVTDRRALGLSPVAGGFFETKLDLEERVQQVETGANLATVTTQRRVLIFRAPSGSWEERRRNLR